MHHDDSAHNQDPYVWSPWFLHTYCHMTQMRPEIGQVVFWVSGEGLRSFEHLWCDLVFVIGEKTYWQLANAIASDDPLVDSPQTFEDHYSWHTDHPYSRRRRFTLKADPDHSFQPQRSDGALIDVVDVLERSGLSVPVLRARLASAGYGSRPLELTAGVATRLYGSLSTAERRLGSVPGRV